MTGAPSFIQCRKASDVHLAVTLRDIAERFDWLNIYEEDNDE
jgi:hypothetical protein